MKTSFPFGLLYLPLLVAAIAASVYLSLTGSWNQPVGASLYIGLAAWVLWLAFLIIRHGVIPTGWPQNIYRQGSPLLFWGGVGWLGVFAAVLLLAGFYL